MDLREWQQGVNIMLLCGNAHQRTFSKKALLNNLDRMTWTDDVCQALSLVTLVLAYGHTIPIMEKPRWQ